MLLKLINFEYFNILYNNHDLFFMRNSKEFQPKKSIHIYLSANITLNNKFDVAIHNRRSLIITTIFWPASLKFQNVIDIIEFSLFIIFDRFDLNLLLSLTT